MLDGGSPIQSFGVLDHPQSSPPLIWKWLGAQPIAVIYLDDDCTDEEQSRVRSLFPEAEVRWLEKTDGPILTPPSLRLATP